MLESRALTRSELQYRLRFHRKTGWKAVNSGRIRRSQTSPPLRNQSPSNTRCRLGLRSNGRCLRGSPGILRLMTAV